MDTLNLLGQALECSVCLEQLDTTSRVLPCQHTFCRRCLLDIINTRKELRCPECRDLVTVPFNSLPPNILLMRILEGIKNIPTSSASSTEGGDVLSTAQLSCSKSSDPFSFFTQVASSGDSGSSASSTSGITSTGSFSGLTSDGEPGRPSHALLQSSPSNPFLTGSQSSDVDTSIADLISRIRNRATAIESQAVLSSNFVPKSTWSNRRLNESVPSSTSSVVTTRNSLSINPTYTVASSRLSNVSTNSQNDPTPSLPLVSASEEPSSSASAPDDVSARTERLNALRLASAKSLKESQACGSLSSKNFVPLIQAKALYNYDGKDARDLNFKKGDTITLCKQIDDNWYQGELDGRTGIVPASYIKLLSSTIASVIPQCKALYDFKVVSEEERNCLMFNKGETITVLRRVDGNWAEGKLNSHIGIFPLSFVELNDSAKALIKMSGSAAPPAPIHSPIGSSLITTVSTTTPCTTTPLCTVTPSLLTGTPSPAHVTPQTPQTYQNGLSTTPSTTRSVSSSLSAARPTTASTQARKPGTASTDAEARRSLTLSSLENLQLYVATYSYRPRKADELELKKSLLYSVSEKCHDGWFKGRCLATDKIGVFPGNYVQLADAQTITAFLARSTMGLRTVAALSASQRGSSPVTRTSPSHALTPGTFSRSKSTSPGAGQISGSSVGDALVNVGNGSACPPELPPRVLTSSGKPIADRLLQADTSTRSGNLTPGTHGSDKKSGSPATGNGISLMRKLTSGKRNSKSPPLLSMENPVFEDSNLNANRISRSGGSNEDDERTNKQPAPLVRERFRCVVPYPANSTDELELLLGDIVYVHKKMEDGWYKGTLQKNGKTGLFPSIFVESC